jgi:hypothetical protein
MSDVTESGAKPAESRAGKLLQSGIFYAAISFMTSVGNYAVQMLMARRLNSGGEYGHMNATLSFTDLLGLPMQVATLAIAHHIAHFKAHGKDAHLQGLLIGCRKFLLHLTLWMTVLVILTIKPLAGFFNIPRTSLMVVALVLAVGTLWQVFATALCMGLSWFKRLALLGLLGVVLRFLVGWMATASYPNAEAGLVASVAALLANLLVLLWRRELSLEGASESPWDREFIQYLMLGAAYVGGNYCFTQGDMLVAQRYFSSEQYHAQFDAFAGAKRLAMSLPLLVGPLLNVLFTHRSGKHTRSLVREQLSLLGLYGVGLVGGALGLILLRDVCVWINYGRAFPEASSMLVPLSLTMVCGGLLQSMGIWALASRWSVVSWLFGVTGLIYWLVLLGFSVSMSRLLWIMPTASACAVGIIFVAWIVALKKSSVASEQGHEPAV